MKIKLDHEDSQVIYYAKGWFKKTDLMDDLKKLTAHGYLLSHEHVDDRTIMNYLMGIAIKTGIFSRRPDLLPVMLNAIMFPDFTYSLIHHKVDERKPVEKMAEWLMSEFYGLTAENFEFTFPDFAFLPSHGNVPMSASMA